MKYLLAVLLLASLAGCALIVNGTSSRCLIESQPPGATIIVDGKAVARTPAKIDVTRQHRQKITLQKEGYEPADITFERHFDAGFILFDLLLTLGIGIPIDIATGAILTIYPGQAKVALHPLAEPKK